MMPMEICGLDLGQMVKRSLRTPAELNRLRVEVAGLNKHMAQLTRSFIDGVEAILLNLAAREDERMTVTDVTSLIDDFRRRLTEE